MEHLAFDLYGTLVDPLAIGVELGRHLGADDAAALSAQWRTRQLDYTFRLTVMARYRDFAWVTERSLVDALAALGLTLGQAEQAAVIDAYDRLPAYPDTGPGLDALRAAGHRLAVLSNGTPTMLERCLAASGLASYFSTVISADPVGAYKPSPAVYAHACAELSRPAGQVRLVSGDPFDVIGAASAGLRTGWLNRRGIAFETLGAPPDVVAPTLVALAELL